MVYSLQLVVSIAVKEIFDFNQQFPRKACLTYSLTVPLNN